jgi:tetratricopeptide (TPR) repeat protein
VHTHTWYFINNNLGYSLNMLGKFDEGEPFCRAAICIDAQRPNAFKNLGIACRGQGRYIEAADCFVKATQVDASDSRSLKLLEELIEQHPELSFDFGSQIELCRHAVQLAHQQRALIPKPAIQRGWRKQLFLFRTRLASWLKNLAKRSTSFPAK